MWTVVARLPAVGRQPSYRGTQGGFLDGRLAGIMRPSAPAAATSMHYSLLTIPCVTRHDLVTNAQVPPARRHRLTEAAGWPGPQGRSADQQRHTAGCKHGCPDSISSWSLLGDVMHVCRLDG